MNENQPPQEPFGQPSGQPPRKDGFFDGIRKSNMVRGDERWIGGVSSAIVDRTRMDLTLVRGLFIVAAVFGIGFLAYGVAWMFLPDARDGKIPAEEISRGQVEGQFLAAAVLIIIGFWAPFSIGTWTIGTWMLIPNGIGIAIIAIVLLVALASNSSGGAGSGAGDYAAGDSETAAGDQAGAAGGVGGTPPPAPNFEQPTQQYARPAEQPTRQFTQPLAASAEQPSAQGEHTYYPQAARAEYVPPPAPVVKKPKTTPDKRASVTLVSAVLGAAMIIAGLYAINDLDAPNFWITPAGVAVVVLGAGVVLAGFLGRSSSVLSPLALVVAFLTVTAGMGWWGTGPLLGEVSWVPSQLSTKQVTKSTGIGSLQLSLVNLERTADTREIEANFGIGDAEIMIPNDRHVVLHASIGVGDIEVEDDPDPKRSGILVGNNTWIFGEEYSEEPELDISVRGGVGSIKVMLLTPDRA